MEAQWKGGVRADGVSSLIVAAGERRGLLGVGFENMMRSWVMKWGAQQGLGVVYFGFLSRWERLLANIHSVYSYTWILIYFTLHFREFLADLFVVELPQNRGCFNTQEFTRFLSIGVVSASSHALWRVLSNKVIRVSVQLTFHTYTPLSGTLCFFKSVCLHRHSPAEWLGLCQ